MAKLFIMLKGVLIAMVLLIKAMMRTCSPLSLLLDEDGKLRVSHHTPTFAFGIPWHAGVPATKAH